MTRQFRNDDASAGSLVGTVVCIIIMGVVFWVLGKAVDKIVGVTNYMVSTFMLSQDAANTIYWISLAFAALPFLYLLAVLLNYWSTAADESSGGV